MMFFSSHCILVSPRLIKLPLCLSKHMLCERKIQAWTLIPLPIGRAEQWPYPQCRVILIGYWLACFGLWCIVSYWGRQWWLLILCPQSGIKVHISSPLVLFSLGPQPLRWLSPVGFTSSVKLIWKHRHWEVMFKNLVRLTLKVHNHCQKCCTSCGFAVLCLCAVSVSADCFVSRKLFDFFLILVVCRGILVFPWKWYSNDFHIYYLTTCLNSGHLFPVSWLSLLCPKSIKPAL